MYKFQQCAVSTVPVVTTVTEPERSVAVAPASVQVPPSSTVSVPLVTVTTGAVVSTTVTVLVAVPDYQKHQLKYK